MFVATILIIFLTILLAYYQWFYQYWRRKNITCLHSDFSSTTEHLGIKFKQIYDIMKKNGWKHAGVYLQLSPVYVISDLEYVKNIMTKDFEFFPHRGLYYNETADPLSAHIFNTSGTKWREMRSKLNQIFTSSKLKLFFPIIRVTSEEKLRKRVEPEHEENKPIDIKQLADWYINDVIEACVFDPSPIPRLPNFATKFFTRSIIRRVKGFIVDNFPKLGKLLNVALIPTDASDLFMKIVAERVQKNTGYNFITLLADSTLTIEEIAAQCFIFFLAGLSTSPTAMSFTIYELAKNQKIQERVREEIRTVLEKYHDEITYDGIHEMKYLDQVFNEALRKYPPAAYLNRKCVKDYKVPGTDIIIEKGTTVVIPVLGIHHDQEIFPNPENFDPERFTEENKRLRHSYSHIPFGEGPRICIGMRFGQLQSKVGLVSLLRNFKFTVNGRTMEPLKMKPKPLVLTPEGGIWLDIHKI